MNKRDAFENIREHREELEAVAESDLPASWIAETLLYVADEDRVRQ